MSEDREELDQPRRLDVARDWLADMVGYFCLAVLVSFFALGFAAILYETIYDQKLSTWWRLMWM